MRRKKEIIFIFSMHFSENSFSLRTRSMGTDIFGIVYIIEFRNMELMAS
jgi:hypothetical protein